MPLDLAQLEISDARRLRAAGQPQAAVARLRSARQRLVTLGARPYLQACDRELPPRPRRWNRIPPPPSSASPPPSRRWPASSPPATPTARRAAELYVSVKTVESHLGHIFAKLGIRSRQGLIAPIGAPESHRPNHNQGHT